MPPLPSAPAGMRTYTPLVTMHRHDPAAGRFAKGYRGRNTGAPPDHEEIDDKSINPATGWRWEDEEHAELERWRVREAWVTADEVREAEEEAEEAEENKLTDDEPMATASDTSSEEEDATSETASRRELRPRDLRQGEMPMTYTGERWSELVCKAIAPAVSPGCSNKVCQLAPLVLSDRRLFSSFHRSQVFETLHGREPALFGVEVILDRDCITQDIVSCSNKVVGDLELANSGLLYSGRVVGAAARRDISFAISYSNIRLVSNIRPVNNHCPHPTTPNHTQPHPTTPNHTQPHPTTPNHTQPHTTTPDHT